MCGSALSVKGGMVSVVKNYLNYKNWGDIKVDYIPTHIEKNKYWLILYFGLKYYKPQNKMFHFCKTFCSKITLVNTIQNVILNPI